ncbi:hypothetical protein J4573_03475 [Actinomadura barringtoniae]|uniref:DUF4129 domain-containing protein n=1 Tax=Actinomadura barringtoniae TaxID=1427535 RepID=A0A939T0S8_9ACTN|nr:hypothetical protein [Actinomadura barringtoniae]MBO2446136.1 hypothetical protein [Actinomadura barringtoniae]
MRHRLVSVMAAVTLTTAGLVAAGCSGEGGGTRAESPSVSRSGEFAPSRTANPPERENASPSPSKSPSQKPSEEPAPTRTSVTRTVKPTATETATATSSVTERATATVTQTATATEPALPAGAGSQTPSESDGNSSLLWLWILLAVIAGGLIAGLVYATRKRSKAEENWESQVAAACAQGATLRDAIRAAVLLPPGPEADARWTDIQRSTDGLSQKFYLLRDTAPSEEEGLRVDDAIAALQSIRLALASASGSSPGEEETANHRSMQANLQTFDYALAALRARAAV